MVFLKRSAIGSRDIRLSVERFMEGSSAELVGRLAESQRDSPQRHPGRKLRASTSRPGPEIVTARFPKVSEWRDAPLRMTKQNELACHGTRRDGRQGAPQACHHALFPQRYHRVKQRWRYGLSH